MRVGKAIGAAIAAHTAISDAHHVPTPSASASGTYTGNDAVNRAIPHGLGTTPKVVLIHVANMEFQYYLGRVSAFIKFMQSGISSGDIAVTAIDDTNFYVGNATNYENSANKTTKDYYWTAIG